MVKGGHFTEENSHCQKVPCKNSKTGGKGKKKTVPNGPQKCRNAHKDEENPPVGISHSSAHSQRRDPKYGITNKGRYLVELNQYGELDIAKLMAKVLNL